MHTHGVQYVISFPRNLDTIVSLPGGESLRGFVLVTVLVEKAAVPGMKVYFHSKYLFFFLSKSEISLSFTSHPVPFPSVN